jgi:hypothetical protein
MEEIVGLLYIRVSGITEKRQKRAILLHLAGTDVQDIFETFSNNTSKSRNPCPWCSWSHVHFGHMT